ncbi:MAG: hypothetical protein ACRDJW_00565 [Thermomicrobiales bacterium]
MLSNLVHYGYGTIQGGLLGAITNGNGSLVKEAPAFGSALWLFGDELAISALGLAAGPTKYPLSQHAHRLAAHLDYGAATGASTRLLRRFL